MSARRQGHASRPDAGVLGDVAARVGRIAAVRIRRAIEAFSVGKEAARAATACARCGCGSVYGRTRLVTNMSLATSLSPTADALHLLDDGLVRIELTRDTCVTASRGHSAHIELFAQSSRRCADCRPKRARLREPPSLRRGQGRATL